MVLSEQPQRLRVRRRRAPAEQRIVPLVDERHAAARLGQDGSERQLANAVHRIDNHFQPGIADRFQVDQLLHGIHVLVGEVLRLHDAGLQREIEFQLDDVLRRERVSLRLDLLRLVVEQQRAVAAKNLQPVPLRRIVAGGEASP